ncbi:ABC transporter ATP-binding protein [Helcobacillus massiliensis]|uniref:ABC transporter ATP-binding protein n=1 Tax=Helcobacillus massiliensis TaxID=521392 RepID=UPI0025536843|nr:ABC transporter ATP-binding protein [Helcobacillus massiliensis]MDK7742242.1 ABC transporter ATP-binding protein [Helcobacillus massiliensis]WOO93495.1 ABC transporter ATP-binding protein [Helcobacillus massiliensis]
MSTALPSAASLPDADAREMIRIESVTKEFSLRHNHSLKELAFAALKGKKLSDSFMALNGVDLTVSSGETVGLIGLNGSGKSTLLKTISGVLFPDSGRVLVRGRVAGLIEVGAGFHPDLSGRENVYLNGAILGMSREQIDACFNDIVAFSEIEKFIDTDVKYYSSGMFLRLAFSVAIHTDPDVFLVDEILSVGDEPFQRKCIERIRQMQADGATMVIVSHELDMLQKLCSRIAVMQSGNLIFNGNPAEAIRVLRGDAQPGEHEDDADEHHEGQPDDLDTD